MARDSLTNVVFDLSSNDTAKVTPATLSPNAEAAILRLITHLVAFKTIIEQISRVNFNALNKCVLDKHKKSNSRRRIKAKAPVREKF